MTVPHHILGLEVSDDRRMFIEPTIGADLLRLRSFRQNYLSSALHRELGIAE
jgi:hypothetical protein